MSTNIVTATPVILSKEEENFKQLVECVVNHLLTHDTYHFRPIQIDGINVYIVLHGKYKILNVESIYINCKVKLNASIETQKYSLFHYKYENITKALEKVKQIRTEFRIYDGELVSAKYYKMMKLEETILPYTDDEVCVVCYENTSDVTECKHPICLGCREKCIIQDNKDCPVCRSKNSLLIYTNISGLVNNDQSFKLKMAIHSEANDDSNNDLIHISHNNGDDSEYSDSDDYSDDETEYDSELDEGFANNNLVIPREYEPGEIVDDVDAIIDAIDLNSILALEDAIIFPEEDAAGENNNSDLNRTLLSIDLDDISSNETTLINSNGFEITWRISRTPSFD